MSAQKYRNLRMTIERGRAINARQERSQLYTPPPDDGVWQMEGHADDAPSI